MVDDKIKAIANAIATAEGFFVSGSIAQRTNNPGDLGTSGSKVNSFSTLQAGWDALYNQVSMILDGSSHYYKPTMTISQVAKIYVDGPKANGMSQGATDWANNVAKELGMTATEVLATYEGKPTTEELTVNPTLQMLLSLFTLGEQTVAAL